MKSYIMATGTVFALITAAHLWRIAVEGRQVADLWFIALTLVTAGLAAWAWRLVRAIPR